VDATAILAEIERLYYAATQQSIQDDFARAVDLLKQLPDEDTRSRAAVYMEGLAEMRSEWAGHERSGGKKAPAKASSPKRSPTG
jgi:hypothetical protein